jgi:hypothetical protein
MAPVSSVESVPGREPEISRGGLEPTVQRPVVQQQILVAGAGHAAVVEVRLDLQIHFLADRNVINIASLEPHSVATPAA